MNLSAFISVHLWPKYAQALVPPPVAFSAGVFFIRELFFGEIKCP